MTYADIVKQAQQQRISITEQQRREIYRLYRDSAREYGRALRRHKDWLTMPDVIRYGQALKSNGNYIYSCIADIIRTGVDDTAKAVTDAQIKYWTHVAPAAMNRMRDAMGPVPQAVVNEIISGGLYKDSNGLDTRIWRAHRQYENDIDYIISRGILEKKSAYDLAKDLETYVKPGAAKSWEWRKVYPRSHMVVDYQAQRLSRTACTHAYQMALERICDPNPFVTAYRWETSNSGKVCPICQAREGKLFQKGSVPLDHPNGMCTLTPVVEQSEDQIADEIAAWVHGAANPALDNWLKN